MQLCQTLSRGTGQGVGTWDGSPAAGLVRASHVCTRLWDTECALRLDLRPFFIFSMKLSQFRIWRCPYPCQLSLPDAPGRRERRGSEPFPGQLGAWREENSQGRREQRGSGCWALAPRPPTMTKRKRPDSGPRGGPSPRARVLGAQVRSRRTDQIQIPPRPSRACVCGEHSARAEPGSKERPRGLHPSVPRGEPRSQTGGRRKVCQRQHPPVRAGGGDGG